MMVQEAEGRLRLLRTWPSIKLVPHFCEESVDGQAGMFSSQMRNSTSLST